jgi:hypothetical protein
MLPITAENQIYTMKARRTLKTFGIIFSFFVVSAIFTHGQANSDFAKMAQGLVSHGDYDALGKLIDSQETEWDNQRYMAYFQNTSVIADILARGTTQRMYWMGRKLMWKMLLKPVPNESHILTEFYISKQEMFLLAAENTASIESLSPEMYAPIRHDTFLMLSEYARQLHATIIPGYHPKFSGAMNDAAERKRLIQNAIDNQIQQEAGFALSSLATDHINYLINAYSHEPRDDSELKTLLDILNVKNVDREKVMQDTR